MTIALGTANVTLSAGPSAEPRRRASRTTATSRRSTGRSRTPIDDAWENQNTSGLDASTTGDADLLVTTDFNNDDRRHSGFRFRNIAIQPGSTINRAVLQVYPTGGYSLTGCDMYADVFGESTADATDFVSSPDINGSNNTVTRVRTGATTALAPGEWGKGWRDIDVTSIVQEIINRGDWANGNDLALLVIGRTEAHIANRCEIEDFSATGTNHARLAIDFNSVALLGNHAWGQVVDQFDNKTVEDDQVLFRFRVYNKTAGIITVSGLTFRLSAVSGIDSSDLSELRIKKGPVFVAAGGVANIDAGPGTGTISFSTNLKIAANGYADYSLVGDAANLAPGDTLTLALDTSDLSVVQGPVGRYIPVPPAVTHAYGARPVMIAYSNTGTNPWPLYYSAHQSGVGYPAGSVAVPGRTKPMHWKVAKTSPDLSKQAVAFTEDNPLDRDYGYASIWDGSNWDDGNGAPYADARYLERTGVTGSKNPRSQDAAYEAVSQRLLVVQGSSNAINHVYYFRYDGAWTASSTYSVNPAYVGYSNVGQFDWVRLTPMPGTNQIAMIGAANQTDGTSYSQVQGAIWNGDLGLFTTTDSFYGPPDQNFLSTEALDVKYVLGGTNAGEAIFVWAAGGDVRWSRWTPSTNTWSTTYLLGTLPNGATPRWLQLECKPAGDDMVLAVSDSMNRLKTYTYDGDSRTWTAGSGFHSTTLSGDSAYNRPFDLTWDILGGLGSNKVLLVYSDGTGVNYRVSTTSGTSFGAATLINGTQALWVQVERAPNPVPHLAYQDVTNKLQAYTYDGTSWSLQSGGGITTTLQTSTNSDQQPFGLAEAPLIGGPTNEGTTWVRLAGFRATGQDSSVLVEWETGAEINNLGFNLYRCLSADGPWEKLNAELITGLGMSPAGRAYSHLDTGLTNGTTYYYRLEDIDTASVATVHGPVSATPQAEPESPPAEGTPGGGSGTGTPPPSGGQGTPGGVETFGNPSAVSFRILSRSPQSVEVELLTGGFQAARDEQGDLRASIPGFDDPSDPQAPALPVKRVLLDAVVGRRGAHRLSGRGRHPLLRRPATGGSGLSPGGGRPPTERCARACVRRSLPETSQGYLPAESVAPGG